MSSRPPSSKRIIGPAHALHLGVVAEGVETAEHLAALSALGCDLAQGFYFRAAIPKDEFEDFLGRGAVAHPVS